MSCEHDPTRWDHGNQTQLGIEWDASPTLGEATKVVGEDVYLTNGDGPSFHKPEISEDHKFQDDHGIGVF